MLRRGRGGGAPGGPPGEQAAAEERALQGPVAVHPAAAEARDLAGREQAGDRLTAGPQDLRVEVGFQAAQAGKEGLVFPAFINNKV